MSPFDWRKTVMSQFANSPRILTLIENFSAYLDQNENLEAFYNNIWNIDTAVKYGLDVWGRILVVSRVLKVVGPGLYFGFAEANDPNVGALGFGTFNTGVVPVTQNYELTDDAYRTLLLAKAAANITNCSIPAINAILMTLFGSQGKCYVTEHTPAMYFGFGEAATGSPNYTGAFGQAPFYNGQAINKMQMNYTFEFTPTSVDLAIIEQSNVLPRPSGVSASIAIVTSETAPVSGGSGFTFDFSTGIVGVLH